MDVHKVFFAELLTGKNALLEAMLAFNAVSRPAEGPPEVSGLAPEQVATLWRRPAFGRRFLRPGRHSRRFGTLPRNPVAWLS